MKNKLTISHGQYSIAGIKEQNEDCSGIQIPDEPALSNKGIAIAIADGMSGADAGKEASHAAVTGFLQDYYSTPDTWKVKKSVSKVLSSINQWLYSHGQRDYNSAKGMVTTLSGIVIKSTTAHIFHIGDCRVSRIRNSETSSMTKEHRVYIARDRDYLSRAMGIDNRIDIDYKKVAVDVGDIFVLTTDGVHDFVDDRDILKIVQSHGDTLEGAASEIGKLATCNGSDDNISCQVIRIDQLPDANESEFFEQLTALPFPPELRPGMIMDGYKILREIHATKHIQVYLAHDTVENRQVVLKTPSVNYEDDAVYIDMFVHEEWIGKRIDNPHVMKVCGTDRKRSFLYYVAEYLEGQTLRQWMDDNPRPPLVEVRGLVSQIVQGLRAFHRLDMVHQDLKPENIIIDKFGTVKIIDFGSTKVAGLEEVNTPIDRNTLVGTLDFIAPEYFLDHPGTNQSDIYSLGVITYQMLTGTLPYGQPLTEKKVKAGKLDYIPINERNPEVPRFVDAAIRKAVHPTPGKRQELLSEFLYDLNNPNSELLEKETTPLIQKNPVGFWRATSLILLLGNLVLGYLLATN